MAPFPFKAVLKHLSSVRFVGIYRKLGITGFLELLCLFESSVNSRFFTVYFGGFRVFTPKLSRQPGGYLYPVKMWHGSRNREEVG